MSDEKQYNKPVSEIMGKELVINVMGNFSDLHKEKIYKEIEQLQESLGKDISYVDIAGMQNMKFFVTSANFVVKNGVNIFELKGHYDNRDTKAILATGIETTISTIMGGLLGVLSLNPALAVGSKIASDTALSYFNVGERLINKINETEVGRKIISEIDAHMFGDKVFFKESAFRDMGTFYMNGLGYTTLDFSKNATNTGPTVIAKNAFDLIKNIDLNRKNVINTGKDIAFSSNAISFVTDRAALNADAVRNDGSIANTLNTARYYSALDGYRVANYNESSDPLSDYLKKTGNNGGTALQNAAIRVNSASGWASRRLPIDPLVIDLNGDGIKLTRYTDTPILFDIDNDGGSLEETGWVSAADGILVRDLNNNGKIDNIAEMFSEYYGGKAGSQGESGEKRYMNGFEALQ
ncbi:MULTISPECIES: hypothetical protein [Gallibacterium]|uniref:Uncharacterized protein n=2 Tax=Gallibacterium TaxID=155493 RepID=A0A1A7PXT2_9PAST|nr:MULTISPECIES: hypothetical protein [Gallibacterium]OBW94253.1 hypothetical protein QV02_08245 [Gallibacterium anatis]OBW98245.1 hypothetical protein QV03_07610 [Gallibacterium anatis]OBX07388.1 hypothetical protein QV07_07155 [Gallibacterium genomosp. 3]